MNLALQRRSRFSALTRRIIYFNAVALILLLGATFVVETNGRSLIDERVSAIRQQALIVSNTLGEYTTNQDTRTIKPEETETLLKQLIQPTNLRARIYDKTGRLMIDTRNLLPRNVVQTVELPPLDFWSRVNAALSRVYEGIIGVRPFSQLPVYSEGGSDGRIYSEVSAALTGEPYTTAERVDQQNKLVLS
ncbi:MAG TPA: stimulus-sensing domain-containing protein, partial [Rhizomicrobium sp.]|nr:stimulus-sensing domain-containing protein [Rhizomicrobium sp.]